ncbi:MAG: hypothetical protein AB7K71_00520 [Polyangiaceae bacterium]
MLLSIRLTDWSGRVISQATQEAQSVAFIKAFSGDTPHQVARGRVPASNDRSYEASPALQALEFCSRIYVGLQLSARVGARRHPLLIQRALRLPGDTQDDRPIS